MARITRQGTGPWWVGITFKCRQCGAEGVLDETDQPYNELRGDNKVLAAVIACPECREDVPISNPRA